MGFPKLDDTCLLQLKAKRVKQDILNQYESMGYRFRWLDDSWTIIVCSPSMFLHETNFPYDGGHSIANSIFKTCAHFFKRMKPAYILHIKHTVNFA